MSFRVIYNDRMKEQLEVVRSAMYYAGDMIKEQTKHLFFPSDTTMLEIYKPDFEFDKNSRDQVERVDIASSKLLHALYDLIPYLQPENVENIDMEFHNHIIKLQSSVIANFSEEISLTTNVVAYTRCIDELVLQLEEIHAQLKERKTQYIHRTQNLVYRSYYFISCHIHLIRLIFGTILAIQHWIHRASLTELRHWYHVLQDHVPEVCLQIISSGLIYFNVNGLQIDSGASWYLYAYQPIENGLVYLLSSLVSKWFTNQTVVHLVSVALTLGLTTYGGGEIMLRIWRQIIALPADIRRLMRSETMNTAFNFQVYQSLLTATMQSMNQTSYSIIPNGEDKVNRAIYNLRHLKRD